MGFMGRINTERAWLYENASQAVRNYGELTPPEALQRLAKAAIGELEAWKEFPEHFGKMLRNIDQLMLELHHESYVNNGDIPEHWETCLITLKEDLERLQAQLRDYILPIQMKLDLAYHTYSYELPNADKFSGVHRDKGFKSSIKQTMTFNIALSDTIDGILLFCSMFSKRYGNEFEMEM